MFLLVPGFIPAVALYCATAGFCAFSNGLLFCFQPRQFVARFPKGFENGKHGPGAMLGFCLKHDVHFPTPQRFGNHMQVARGGAGDGKCAGAIYSPAKIAEAIARQ